MVYRRTAAVCARQERTRDAILRAARAVVAAGGLTGTSMSAVAARAGVAVGTVYRYFPSKAALLTEVVRDTCRHELDQVAGIAAGPGPAAERLHAAVTTFARRALRSGRVAFAMIAEPTVAEAETLRLAIRAELAALLATIVAAGVATGELDPQPAPITGTALVGAVSEILVAQLSPPGDEPVDEEAVVEEIGRVACRCAGVRVPARRAVPA